MTPDIEDDPEGLADSSEANEASPGLPPRFPPAIEAQFIKFNLQLARGGIRAWHTTILALAAMLLLLAQALALLGSRYRLLPWPGGRPDLVLVCLIGTAMLTRAMLVAVAWSRDFKRLYPRVVFPLALISHTASAIVFGSQIFGPYPGYLAATITYAFAASILTGLLLRQSLCVNAVSIAGLAFGAWRFHTAAFNTVSGVFHVFLCCVMAAVAAIAAVAIERSSRALFMEHRRVGEMAARDGLTGLKNRRAFDEHLRRVWQQAVRERRALAVLLIDVDFFKAYNDTLGHHAGDEALQRIAGVVQSMARRPLDLAARYGGEELAIILFDLNKEHVVALAHRVQREVQSLAIVHPASAVSGCVTVSTGVAFVRPSLERSAQGAVQLADRGLYAAKRNGRNRVAVLDRDIDPTATGVFEAALPRVRLG